MLFASRRGVPYAASPTKACTSTKTGREPTIEATTHEPAASLRRERKKSADGFEISSNPFSRMANTQISSIDPKRFLYARRIRTSPFASPSKYSTVSTRCSTMRGPAIDPSLVTCPTMNGAQPVRLENSTSACVQSRTCPKLPAYDSDDGSHVV